MIIFRINNWLMWFQIDTENQKKRGNFHEMKNFSLQSRSDSRSHSYIGSFIIKLNLFKFYITLVSHRKKVSRANMEVWKKIIRVQFKCKRILHMKFFHLIFFPNSMKFSNFPYSSLTLQKSKAIEMNWIGEATISFHAKNNRGNLKIVDSVQKSLRSNFYEKCSWCIIAITGNCVERQNVGR